MLESLDVLIGLAVVMLFLSMPVTLVTQFINDLINQRGRFLRSGVAQLLRHIDPKNLGDEAAKDAAEQVLKHPTIASPWLGIPYLPLRAVGEIHREDLTRIILSLGLPPSTAAANQGPVDKALKEGGVTDPPGTLEAIRMSALQLERSNPEMSNSARHTQAILLHAESPFVAKLNAWFDQTIDRVSDRFTAVTRFVAVIAAFLVAWLLDVDSIDLINRLSTDKEVLARLVEHAPKMSEPGGVYDPEWLSRLKQVARTELIEVPDYGAGLPWITLGILLTAAFLSLGGPFWYALLKNLLKLRSLVATKDDEDRRERQTTQAAGAGAIASAPVGRAAPPAGERGDLGAQG